MSVKCTFSITKFLKIISIILLQLIVHSVQQCPTNFYADSLNICYYFGKSDSKVSNDTLLSTCQGKNSASYYPIFKTLSEFTAFSYLEANISMKSDYWIGLIRPNTGGSTDHTATGWNWYGNIVTYGTSSRGSWASNKPDTTASGLHCAFTQNGQWTDEDCAHTRHVLCQCRSCYIPTTTTTTSTTTKPTTTTTKPTTTTTKTSTSTTTSTSTSTSTSTTTTKSTTTTLPTTTTTTLLTTTTIPDTTTITTTPNCMLLPWTAWSPCSLTCGNGTMSQHLLNVVGSCPSTNVKNCYTECPKRKDVLVNDPLTKTERTVATVTQTLGCTVLIVLLCMTLGLFVVLRIISLERMLHMCQEIALLIAHGAINLSMKHNISAELGTAFGIILQYCFLANFTFLILEALQTFCILKNVICSGGFFGWKMNLLLGWGIPLPIVGITAAIYPDDYTSDNSFWLNFGSNIQFFTTVPVIFAMCLILIMTEAATMGETQQWPLTTEEKHTAAMISQKGAVLILLFNLLSWGFGAFALFYQKVALYAFVFAFNCLLGGGIFFFHTLSNEKVAKYLKDKFCGKKK